MVFAVAACVHVIVFRRNDKLNAMACSGVNVLFTRDGDLATVNAGCLSALSPDQVARHTVSCTYVCVCVCVCEDVCVCVCAKVNLVGGG